MICRSDEDRFYRLTNDALTEYSISRDAEDHGERPDTREPADETTESALAEIIKLRDNVVSYKNEYIKYRNGVSRFTFAS